MSAGAPEEIKEVFFAGQDFSKEILELCKTATKTQKVKSLQELILNGYFN